MGASSQPKGWNQQTCHGFSLQEGIFWSWLEFPPPFPTRNISQMVVRFVRLLAASHKTPSGASSKNHLGKQTPKSCWLLVDQISWEKWNMFFWKKIGLLSRIWGFNIRTFKNSPMVLLLLMVQKSGYHLLKWVVYPIYLQGLQTFIHFSGDFLARMSDPSNSIFRIKGSQGLHLWQFWLDKNAPHLALRLAVRQREVLAFGVFSLFFLQRKFKQAQDGLSLKGRIYIYIHLCHPERVKMPPCGDVC